MRSRFRYRSAMVKFPIAGDVKMITYILETSLQMTLAKLLYGEGNIAARCAAMNHQQLNLSREILIFRTFHADVLQMSRTGRYPDSRNDRSRDSHDKLENVFPKLLFHTNLN